jgi:hypothetical protein
VAGKSVQLGGTMYLLTTEQTSIIVGRFGLDTCHARIRVEQNKVSTVPSGDDSIAKVNRSTSDQ